MTSAQRSPATPRTGSTGTGVTRFCAWTVLVGAGKISGAQPRNHRQQTRCHRQPKLNPLQHLFNLRRLLSIENLTALRRQSSIRTRLHLVPLSPNTTPYRRCAPNSSFPNPNRGTGVWRATRLPPDPHQDPERLVGAGLKPARGLASTTPAPPMQRYNSSYRGHPVPMMGGGGGFAESPTPQPPIISATDQV